MYLERDGWGVQLVSGNLRVYRIGESRFAEEDVEVSLAVLPELYEWLAERRELERGIKGHG